MAEPKNQQRYYNVAHLNVWFGVSSVILLGTVLALMLDDHSRSWKDYQREFRALEIERAKALAANEHTRLSESETYRDLEMKLALAREALAAQEPKLQELGKQRDAHETDLERLTKDNQFVRADFDALRYSYEEALAHSNPEADSLKSKLDALRSRRTELRREVEQAEQTLAADDDAMEAIRADAAGLEKEQVRLGKQLALFERKLRTVDPDSMSFSNRIADWVRDLPLVDFASPYYGVDQVVVRAYTEDVNFARVPRVDRCTTCHQGIVQEDFKTAAQPFRAHSRLDLFLSADSPHPIDEFGCTSCHRGRGRGTDFSSASHTPSSPAQAEEWKTNYDWKPLQHWEEPMYPSQYSESGCLECHIEETVIPGADRLSLGLQLFEKTACFGCHAIERFNDRPKVGPSLRYLAAKTSREWVYHWIDNPRGFRPATWMPHFYNLSNSSDPESQAQSAQEVLAIVQYLFEQSEDFSLGAIPVSGNAKRGKEIVASVGCLGCHRAPYEDPAGEARLHSLLREHGPHLVGLGTKTSKPWIYHWLKDPHRYSPKSKMPNMRLTDQEASDIAEYLNLSRREAFAAPPLPSIDEGPDGILDRFTVQYLMQTQPESAARETSSTMDTHAKQLFIGEKLIRHRGCFACHDIPGFEDDLPIGTELTEEGSKSVHRLDFGFLDELEESKQAWYTQKLKAPRSFDRSRVRRPEEKLRMPDFALSDAEAEAIVTVLLGLVKKDPENKLIIPRTEANLFKEAGQILVREYNCQGCHIIAGEGGAIEPTVAEWLIEYGGRVRNEAEAVANTFAPPNLIGEGKKVQGQWLFDFVNEPATVRPWLKVRMPRFAFDNAQRNTLVKYFSVLDGEEFPFETKIAPEVSGPFYEAGKRLFSADYFDCGNCHIQGDKMPGGEPERWAPDFAMSLGRLKTDWVLEWLYGPQKLMPGTKMPTYFEEQYFADSGPDDILGGDEHKQIAALRNYVFAIGVEAKTGRSNSEAATRVDGASINAAVVP